MQTHSEIASKVTDAIRQAGGFAFRVWGNPMMLRGLPDIIACVGGRFVGIEIKTGRDKQKANQQKVEALIRNAGGFYFVCYSVEDALLTLSRFGLLHIPIQEALPLREESP